MDQTLQSIRTTLDNDSRAITYVRDNMDLETIALVATTLHNCLGVVYISGCGTSGAAGKKIAHTLNCVERPAVFLEPSDAVHGGLGVVTGGDVVILLSNGGQTEELLSMLPGIRQKGAHLIIVTQNEESALALAGDFVLKVKTEREADPFDVLATASIIAVLAVFDAVCVCIMRMRGFTPEKFGVIHPGGAVGARLRGEEQ